MVSDIAPEKVRAKKDWLRDQLRDAVGVVACCTTSGRPGRGRVDESTSQAGTAKAERASRKIAEAATRRREEDIV